MQRCIGARNLSQGFVRLARRAVKRDLHGERAVFGEVVGDAFIDHRAVGEESDQEAALFGFRINLRKSLRAKISPPV